MAFRFETLEIWQESNIFTSKIYNLTRKFPQEEQFGLVNQLRRAAVSVSANIAEGSGSDSKKDFHHFLDISIKSIYEIVSHIHLAHQQKYISEQERQNLHDEAEIIVKKIQAFRSWLRKSS